MATSRSVMVLSGGGLVTLAMVGVAARLFQLGPLADPVSGLPGAAFFAAIGALAVVGVLLIVFAPPSRSGERRVRLEDQTASQQVLRPAAKEEVPITRGPANGQASPAASLRKVAADVVPEDAGEERPLPPPAQTTESEPPLETLAERPASPPPARRTMNDPDGLPAWGEAAHITPPVPSTAVSGGFVQQAPVRWASASPESAAGQASQEEAYGGNDVRGRTALLARLDELDRKANSIKVQFGLGKLSAGAYSMYLREIESERMKLERSLIEEDALD